MTLRARATTGTLWSGLARVIDHTIGLVVFVTLARLLLPKDFGLIGMAAVFIGFARLFADLGLGAALVQRSRIEASHASTVFWINSIAGLLLVCAYFVAAPLIAAFYAQPELTQIVRVLGVSFLIAAVGIVPRAMLRTRFAFSTLARIEITATIVAAGCAIAVALAGGKAWSLVVQTLTSALVASILACWFTRWAPNLQFRPAVVRELLSYGANLSGFNIINYWARNIDNLLIGRVFGASSLGLYTRAYSLMLLPTTQVIGVLSQVMFPILSSVKEDRHRAGSIYLRAVGALTIATLPMMLGLLVVADTFVLAIFGSAWSASIPLVRVFSAVSVIQTLVIPNGWLYTSQGRTDRMFLWGLFANTVTIVALVIGVSRGSLLSTAVSYLVANCLLFYPSLRLATSLVGMRPRDVVHKVAPAVGCAFGMAFCVWAVGILMPDGAPPAAQLALEVAVGVSSYGLLLRTVRPSAVRDIITSIRGIWGQRTATTQAIGASKPPTGTDPQHVLSLFGG